MSAPPEVAAAIGERHEALRARIASAGTHDVTVIAVTKALGSWAIDAASACGIGDIGENYAQECVAKLAECDRGAQAPCPLRRTGPAKQGQVAGRLRRRVADA